MSQVVNIWNVFLTAVYIFRDFEIKQQTDHSLYQTEMELKRAKHSIEAVSKI